MADKKENTKTLAQNKKARHEYFILETIELQHRSRRQRSFLF